MTPYSWNSENVTNIPVLTVTHSAAGAAMPVLIRYYDSVRGR